MAAAGHTALVAEAHRLLESLTARLAAEAGPRRLKVTGDLVIGLEEYLRTRVVELVVHTDDLAVSLGVVAPFPRRPLRAPPSTR